MEGQKYNTSQEKTSVKFPGAERRVAKTGNPLTLGKLVANKVTESLFPQTVRSAQTKMELLTNEQQDL